MSSVENLLNQTCDIENILYYEQKNRLYENSFIKLVIDESIKDLKLRIKKTKELSFQPIFSNSYEEKDTLLKFISFIGNLDIDSKSYYKIHMFPPNVLMQTKFPLYIFSDEKFNIKISIPNKDILIKNVSKKSNMIICEETHSESDSVLYISAKDAKTLCSNLKDCKISIQLSQKGKIRDTIFESQNQDIYSDLIKKIEHQWISDNKSMYIQMLQFSSNDYKSISKSSLAPALQNTLDFFDVSIQEGETFDLSEKVNQIKFKRKNLNYFPAIHHFYNKFKKFSLNSMNIELLYSSSLEVDRVIKEFYEREMSLLR